MGKPADPLGIQYFVVIVNTKTEKISNTMGPFSSRKAEKVERGANINLNHDVFHTEIRSNEEE